jgi:hypothetical protein
MPRNDRLRFGHEQYRTPARPQSGEPHPKETIGGTELDTTFLRPSQDYDLVAQGDDLRLKSQAALEPGPKGRQTAKRLGCTWKEESLAMGVDNINEFNANEIFSMDTRLLANSKTLFIRLVVASARWSSGTNAALDPKTGARTVFRQ